MNEEKFKLKQLLSLTLVSIVAIVAIVGCGPKEPTNDFKDNQVVAPELSPGKKPEGSQKTDKAEPLGKKFSGSISIDSPGQEITTAENTKGRVGGGDIEILVSDDGQINTIILTLHDFSAESSSESKVRQITADGLTEEFSFTKEQRIRIVDNNFAHEESDFSIQGRVDDAGKNMTGTMHLVIEYPFGDEFGKRRVDFGAWSWSANTK